MPPASPSPASDSPGKDLRHIALTTPAETLGFSADDEYPEVNGILVDWPIDNQTVASILAMRNGTSSLYSKTTFGVIGGEAHAPIRQDAKRCVRLVADCLASSEAVADYPLPTKPSVYFYLLTYGGVRRCAGVEAGLVRRADPSLQVRTGRRGAFRGPLLSLPGANGSLETARTLIAAEADVDAADATGLTPLMCAAEQGHEAIIRLLLEAGAMLELRDQEGFTALIFAANRGQTAVTGILLAAGADVNAAASDGSTPIMFAAQHGHEETVKTLLAAGADPSVIGRHGLSAIGFAKQNSHVHTLALLLEAARCSRCGNGGRRRMRESTPPRRTQGNPA